MNDITTFYPIRKIANIKDMITQSADLFADKSAFMLKNSSGEYYNVTYKEFYNEINSLGSKLVADGYKDAHIAVMGANSYKWALSYMSIVCGTGVVVPIDKDLPFNDIKNIIEVGEVSAIFLDKKASKLFAEHFEELPENFKIICFDDIREEVPSALFFDEYLEEGKKIFAEGFREFIDAEIDAEAMGILIFTSGTTGMAKGVMLSHRNICSDISLLSGVVKIYPEDRLLSILPLHHTYECTLGFTMIMYSGACIAYCEGLRYIVRNLQEVQPTVFVTVPLMLEKFHHNIMKKAGEKKGGKLMLSVGKAITNASSALGINVRDKIFGEIQKVFGGKLRLIITGAAPVNPEVVKDFKSFGIHVYLGYGLTECSPLVIGNNDRLELADSVGVPLPGVEAKIINPDENGIGEICVKGPMVMMGYYKNPEETSKVFDEDGWFKTGDIGTVDEHGHYRISGRIKNVIVTKNGKNIYPEEVEFYLNNSPLISESIVVGKDDGDNDDVTVTAKIFPNFEELTKALKKPSPSMEEITSAIKEVIKDVNKKLPKYKAIKDFDIRETEFIKTTTQKIKRYAEEIKDKEKAKDSGHKESDNQ